MPQHKDQYDLPVVNPAALPGQVDGKEYKYERVETAKVDEAGNAVLVDAREDRGMEDPGMNFKDMRPAVAPGTPIGVVPSAVSGVAPQLPLHQIPGPFVDTRDAIITSAPLGLVRETDRVFRASSGFDTDGASHASLVSGGSIHSSDRASLASGIITPSLVQETTTIKEKRVAN